MMQGWTRLRAMLQAWYVTVWRHLCAATGFPRMLRCREVADLLLQYVENTLDPRTRQAFERHIADCVSCWRFLHTYRETMTLGHQLRDEAMPPEVRQRLETFVRSRLSRPS